MKTRGRALIQERTNLGTLPAIGAGGKQYAARYTSKELLTEATAGPDIGAQSNRKATPNPSMRIFRITCVSNEAP